MGGDIRGKTMGAGARSNLTPFDMREAPSIPLITARLDMGAKVRAFEPSNL
jgi:UDPglucose 6-dehydrogenase